MKRALIASAAMTVCLAVAPAIADSDRHQIPDQLTRSEAIQRAAERFDAADTNGDGVLSRDEMRSGAQRMRDRLEERRAGARDRFASIDLDGSGALDLAEFRVTLSNRMDESDNGFGERFEERSAALFERMDADQSGLLTLIELRGARQALRARRD